MAGLMQWLYHDLEEQTSRGKVADFDIDPIMNFFLRDGQFTIWNFPISKPALKEHRPRRARKNSSGSLQKVIEAYASEQDLGGNWTPRTKLEVEACLNLLLSFCGNVSISSITFKVMRDFKQALMKLPANMRKMPQYRNKSVHELLKMDIEKPMSPITVNKYLGCASALFKYAVRNGYMPQNPGESMHISISRRDDEFRAVFSDEDLRNLFHSPEYINDTHKRPFEFWLPVLALFTGCRLEELAQLHLEDIQEVDRVWVFDINTKGEKRVKTKAGIRVVPIHPFILNELHILGYVDTLRSMGHQRLFPELPKRPCGYGQNAGNWFAKYRKRCGIVSNGERRDFHSFRHTLANVLKQNHSIDSVMISELLGHEVGSITMGRYGKRYSPRMLLEEAVMKVRYGVDLGHLMKSKYVQTW
jgi:integrase